MSLPSMPASVSKQLARRRESVRSRDGDLERLARPLAPGSCMTVWGGGIGKTRGKDALLILDNAEHVVDACARVVKGLA